MVKPKSLLKIVDAKSWAVVWDLSLVEAGESGEWNNDLTATEQTELEAGLQMHYPLFRDLHVLNIVKIIYGINPLC